MELLCVCHSVIIDPNTKEFSSSSPDEAALLSGAKDLGFQFYERDNKNVVKVRFPPYGKEKNFQVLNILEFNSTRKRMSVIVKNLENNKI